MNYRYYYNDLKRLIWQRRILLPVTLLLAISQILLIGLLWHKQERIVVVPTVVDKSFWVEKNQVSASYLEQMGLFISSLILTNSSATAKRQSEIILRHTEPEYAAKLTQALITEEKRLKQDQISYVFYPTKVVASSKELSVILEGKQMVFSAGKRIDYRTLIYRINFSCNGGRLLLISISE